MKPENTTIILVLLLLFVAPGCDNSEGPVNPGIPGTIDSYIGQGSVFGYSGDDGPASTAKLGFVTGVAVDKFNNVYLTDAAASTVRAVVASSGTIFTLAGKFRGFNVPDPTPYAGDGGLADSDTCHLNVPLAVGVDLSGNVYIADAGNNVIRRMSSTSGNISTVAGKPPGTSGYSGDGGPATEALLFNPQGIAVDAVGNLFISDTQNHVIRKVAQSTGTITTIAGLGPGNPGYTGDNGLATAAALNSPQGIAVDDFGNIYISDTGNNVIRKISAGNITTIAGTGLGGYTGDGGPALLATFGSVKGIAVDDSGNVFIADSSNNAVRVINGVTGVITTIAGNGLSGFSGDGGLATAAMLSNPLGVAIDGDGILYIAEAGNSVIRIVF